MQSNVFGTTIGNIIRACLPDPIIRQNLQSLQDYNDYNSQWYLEYGFQLAMNALVGMLLPHLLAVPFELVLFHFKYRQAKH